MTGKAEWRDYNWNTSMFPERRDDYESYQILVLPDETLEGQVIGAIQQFANNPRCFYATIDGDRSGCLGTADWARQWVETRTGNKPN